MTPKTFVVGQILSHEGVNQQLLLLENLMSRMEYNEKQGIWAIKGSITKREREVLNNWYHTVADGQYRIMKEGKES